MRHLKLLLLLLSFPCWAQNNQVKSGLALLQKAFPKNKITFYEGAANLISGDSLEGVYGSLLVDPDKKFVRIDIKSLQGGLQLHVDSSKLKFKIAKQKLKSFEIRPNSIFWMLKKVAGVLVGEDKDFQYFSSSRFRWNVRYKGAAPEVEINPSTEEMNFRKLLFLFNDTQVLKQMKFYTKDKTMGIEFHDIRRRYYVKSSQDLMFSTKDLSLEHFEEDDLF